MTLIDKMKSQFQDNDMSVYKNPTYRLFKDFFLKSEIKTFLHLKKSIGKEYWYRLTILLLLSIVIGIGNTFLKEYWYWYCQYF